MENLTQLISSNLFTCFEKEVREKLIKEGVNGLEKGDLQFMFFTDCSFSYQLRNNTLEIKELVNEGGVMYQYLKIDYHFELNDLTIFYRNSDYCVCVLRTK